MDIQKYLPKGTSAGTIARLDEIELGRILIHAFAVEDGLRDKALRRNPSINTADVRKDFRHKLGELEGLAFLNWLKTSAQKQVNGGTP